MEGKRKKVVLTIKEKLDVIQQLENGESVVSISDQYGISQTTVRDIKKTKSNLLDFVSRLEGSNSLKRKSMKKSKYEEVDVALLDWFIQKRTVGALVSGPMCVRQAKYFHEAFGLEGKFNASTGWLTRFKKRYGICEIVEEAPNTDISMDDANFLTLEKLQSNPNDSSPRKSQSKRTLAFDQKAYDEDPLGKMNFNFNDSGVVPQDNNSSLIKSVKQEKDMPAPSLSCDETAYLSNKDAITSINNVLLYMKQSGFDSKEMSTVKKVKDKICAIGKVLNT